MSGKIKDVWGEKCRELERVRIACSMQRDEIDRYKAECDKLRGIIEGLVCGLEGAIKELERINNIKDGQPLVSHNLLYNLYGISSKAKQEAKG